MAFENLSKMDPYILLSMVNMKLRDFDDHDLDSFCATYEIERCRFRVRSRDQPVQIEFTLNYRLLRSD